MNPGAQQATLQAATQAAIRAATQAATQAAIQAAIDGELHALAKQAGDPMRRAVEYALAGGKRTRGLLLVFVGGDPTGASDEGSDKDFSGGTADAATLVRAAACLELMHAATLVQDDIFDRSRMRRGRAATHVRFGLPTATLVSDWMLIEALRTAYRLHPDFGDALSRCAKGMVAGAQRELVSPRGRTTAALREDALAIAHAKTGEMFGLALCGATLLRGDPCRAEQLHGCGVDLGLAFQYLDDVLDLHGDPAAAGKEVGCDLRSGLLTLPVLDALPLLPPALAFGFATFSGPMPASLELALQTQEIRQYLQRQAWRQWATALANLRETLARDGRAPGEQSALLMDALRCLAETMLQGAGMEVAA